MGNPVTTNRMAAQPTLRRIAGMLATCAMAASLQCCANPPSDWAAKEWSSAMISYNIEPVYPPTEDVHVGDIFAVGKHAENQLKDSPLFTSAKYDSVPQQALLDRYYGANPVFPDYVPDIKQDGSPVAQQAATLPGGLFAPAVTPTKLALEALPGFTLSNTQHVSFAASIPGQAVSALFGGAVNLENASEIRIDAAETYGIPAAWALGELDGYCARQPDKCSYATVRRVVCSVAHQKVVGAKLYFVAKVFMARKITYSYDKSSALGALGSIVAKARTNALAATPPTLATPPTPTPASDSAKASADAEATKAQDLLKSVNDSVSSLSASTPGATFSIGSASDQGISLIQTFERPVVIGYRAVKTDLIKSGSPILDANGQPWLDANKQPIYFQPCAGDGGTI